MVHAAALKQVPACEYNPFEAIQTNVIGGKNVIDAAINQGVRLILALSTDKAVNPVNLYGASKLYAEKVFVQANAYAGAEDTPRLVLPLRQCGGQPRERHSNVPGAAKDRQGYYHRPKDDALTRSHSNGEWSFVVRCIEQMRGGEIFIPKIPSMKLVDMAEAITPGCELECIGIRSGEKLHEVLLSEDESRNAVETDDM